MSGYGYGQAGTWSTGPTTIPLKWQTSTSAYNAGVNVGLKDYNAEPWNQGQTKSIYASSNTSPYSSDYKRGYKAASSGKYGGTNRRKYRKTRKTMRKRSYRRRQ